MTKKVKNFFKSLFNIFLFLPHFFSALPLLMTLFYPWKRLSAKKEELGFSMSEWFNRLMFNVISRTLGFIMRSSLLIFFLFVMVTYILLIPILSLLFFLLLPLLIIIDDLKEPEDIKKAKLKKQFVTTHSLTKETYKLSEAWFDYIYDKHLKKNLWWQLDNLMSTSPLARDWAIGFTPTLDRYCDELMSAEYQSTERHIVGRIREIEEIEQILSKTRKANVLIVGDDGIGKHTIIDAFSNKIFKGQANEILNYKRILKLNLESVLNETTDQKQREALVEQLFNEAVEAGNVILVLFDFERYIVSSKEGVNLIIPIQKFAESPKLQFIASTTPYYYEKYIYHNDKLNQLFPRINVSEITKQDALKILMDIALTFENRYNITIPYETISKIITKSEFYITNIPFPEKAISLLDRCASRAFQNKQQVLNPDIIDEEITEITQAPTKLDGNLKQKLLNIEKAMMQKVIAQDRAISSLANSIRRAFLLLGKRKKPLASFIFLGPTGVGKTETAKALMETFFENQKKLLRFDMSQYQSKENIRDLIGNPDTQAPGILTKTIRENPYGILLLDEVEKADKELLNIFLTILDEGYFTDALGEKVDCKNLIIIATSNAASDFIFQSLSTNKAISDQNLVDYLVNKNYFSPELLNRFDGIVYFEPLSKQALNKIAQNMISQLLANYKSSNNISINISPTTLEYIVTKGYNKQFGARNMQRTIMNEIGGRIDKQILEGSIKAGTTITI
jgi:ATP-dependent Clp protease ATP-binding subunit ClpA